MHGWQNNKNCTCERSTAISLLPETKMPRSVDFYFYINNYQRNKLCKTIVKNIAILYHTI